MQNLLSLIPQNATADELFSFERDIEERADFLVEALGSRMNLEGEDLPAFHRLLSKVESFQDALLAAVDTRLEEVL